MTVLSATMSRGIAALFLLTCLVAAGATTSAEEPLEEAKRAYESAAYEDALRLLEPLDSPEARQYSALCLLALGRADAAARAVEAMVTSAPLFTPSSVDLPPRFATLVAETRRKVLPVVARKAFAEGRDRFNAKQATEAMPLFELALKLLDDPLWSTTSDAQDLRTLAEGFVQLARSSPLAAPPEPNAASAANAAASATPAATPAAPPASAPPASRVAARSLSRVTVPTPISEVVPQLPANLTRAVGPVARLKLLIGADGKVASAVVEQSAHPRYDEMLVEASSAWRYEPGTLDGKPVPSERILTLRLR
jgi:tetratricopeptide (TPR) repeat protein